MAAGQASLSLSGHTHKQHSYLHKPPGTEPFLPSAPGFSVHVCVLVWQRADGGPTRCLGTVPTPAAPCASWQLLCVQDRLLVWLLSRTDTGVSWSHLILTGVSSFPSDFTSPSFLVASFLKSQVVCVSSSFYFTCLLFLIVVHLYFCLSTSIFPQHNPPFSPAGPQGEAFRWERQWCLIYSVFYTAVLHSTTPNPSLGVLMAPNAIIDIMGGNSELHVGPKGREMGHSCYVNVSGDRGR